MISPVQFGALRIREDGIKRVAERFMLDGDYTYAIVQGGSTAMWAGGMFDALEKAGLDVVVSAGTRKKGEEPALCYKAVLKGTDTPVGQASYSAFYQPAKRPAKPAATMQAALRGAAAHYAAVFAQFIGGETRPEK